MKMVTVQIKVKPGQEAAFEAVVTEMRDKCLANEPGCKFYQIGRAEQPHTYLFIEGYADDAAVAAHRASDHFKTLGRKMGEYMDGKPEVLGRMETI